MSQKEGSSTSGKEKPADSATFAGTGAVGGFGTGASGAFGSDPVGSPMGSSGAISSAVSGGTSSDPDVCQHCGQPLDNGSRLEQFLGRLGITEEMIVNLKGQFQNVDIDEYLNTARDYLKDGSSRATIYAKENPGKVAAGVAAIALGAGLIYSRYTATQHAEDRVRQLALREALRGRQYPLDEVLRELDVTT